MEEAADDRRSQELMEETLEQGRDLAEKSAELARHEVERFVHESAPSLIRLSAGTVIALGGAAACVAGLGGMLGRRSGFAMFALGGLLGGAGVVVAAAALRDLPEGALREEISRFQYDLGQTLRRRS